MTPLKALGLLKPEDVRFVRVFHDGKVVLGVNTPQHPALPEALQPREPASVEVHVTYVWDPKPEVKPWNDIPDGL